MEKELPIVWMEHEVKLKDLIPYEKNPRRISKESFERLVRRLEEEGYHNRIRANLDNTVIGGHSRKRALKAVGFKDNDLIKVLKPDRMLTEKEFKDQNISDNGTFGEFDMDILSIEYEPPELIELGVPEYLFDGLNSEEEIEEIEGEDEAPEVDKKNIVSKLGDLWILGDHRVLCGDATSTTDVDKLMKGEKADMVFTDPPYGMNLDCDFSKMKGSAKFLGKKNGTNGKKYTNVKGDHEDFTPDLINTIFANFDYASEIFLWGADYYAELLPNKNNGSWLVWDKRKESQEDAFGSEFELCWSRVKHKRRVLRHDWFGFLSSQNAKEAQNRLHPTQKPTSLIVDVIEQWGKDKNSIVDIYGGSGSTLIACEKTKRKCYMMELEPAYMDIIIKRWQDLTGQEAMLEGSNKTYNQLKIELSK